MFIGANMDAVSEARKFGISEDRAVEYISDNIGTGVCYGAINTAIADVRANRPMTADWKCNIENDRKSRRRGR